MHELCDFLPNPWSAGPSSTSPAPAIPPATAPIVEGTEPATSVHEQPLPHDPDGGDEQSTLLEARLLSAAATTGAAEHAASLRQHTAFWADPIVLAGVALFVTMNGVAKGILTLMETIASPLYEARGRGALRSGYWTRLT